MLEMTGRYNNRQVVRTSTQYRKNITILNGKKNLFRSVYHFNHFKNGKPDFSNIIINQIFIEFDKDNSYEVSRKFALELKKNNIKFRINFSGRRGFHFYICVEHKNIEHKGYLISLYKYIIDKYDIEYDMDCCVIGNIRQMRRIENTIHIASELYCIPLTFSEFLSLNFNEIKELAKKPRNFDISWIEGNKIKLDYVNLNSSINEKYISTGDGEFKEIGNILPEPCIVRILHSVHPSHEERFLLCQWLSYYFRNGTDICDFNLEDLSEKIITFMKGLNWDDYSEAPNTAKSTRYQVFNIISKKFNFIPNCEWRKLYNICCSEYCYTEKCKNR